MSVTHFPALVETALQDYEKQTGIPLAKHPLAEQLQNCDSVESATALLYEQARVFSEFRSDKITKLLKIALSGLCALSKSAHFRQFIDLPFTPAYAIHVGLTILNAVKDVGVSYDTLDDIFELIERFLERLEIYTRIPPTVALTELLVKILVELLSVLALATKQIKQGRAKTFVKKLFGEKDIEAVLQRLDRLTLNEAQMVAVQTLEVVWSCPEHEGGHERRQGIDRTCPGCPSEMSKWENAQLGARSIRLSELKTKHWSVRAREGIKGHNTMIF